MLLSSACCLAALCESLRCFSPNTVCSSISAWRHHSNRCPHSQPSPYPHSHAASDLQVLYSILQRVGLPYSGQVLYRTAVFLVEVMREWRGLLVGEGAAYTLHSERAAPPDVDIACVEGFALSILCHPDIHVRYASTALPVDTNSS